MKFDIGYKRARFRVSLQVEREKSHRSLFYFGLGCRNADYSRQLFFYLTLWMVELTINLYDNKTIKFL